jgi:hypothetical protein
MRMWLEIVCRQRSAEMWRGNLGARNTHTSWIEFFLLGNSFIFVGNCLFFFFLLFFWGGGLRMSRFLHPSPHSFNLLTSLWNLYTKDLYCRLRRSPTPLCTRRLPETLIRRIGLTGHVITSYKTVAKYGFVEQIESFPHHRYISFSSPPAATFIHRFWFQLVLNITCE